MRRVCNFRRNDPFVILKHHLKTTIQESPAQRNFLITQRKFSPMCPLQMNGLRAPGKQKPISQDPKRLTNFSFQHSTVISVSRFGRYYYNTKGKLLNIQRTTSLFLLFFCFNESNASRYTAWTTVSAEICTLRLSTCSMRSLRLQIFSDGFKHIIMCKKYIYLIVILVLKCLKHI